MHFVGIDPGSRSGAIGVIYGDGRDPIVSDLPVYNKSLDLPGLKSLIESLDIDPDDSRIVIELVGSMPGQGVSSTFSFGEGFGAIQGVLVGMGYRFTRVPPQVWKGSYRLGSGDDDRYRLKAIELFPALHYALRLKKDHNKSDAILIAHYLKTRTELCP